MRVRVECYAGYKADERPVRFRVGEQWLGVLEILDRWYAPGETWFKLHAWDGNFYILCHHSQPQQDDWTLEPCREAPGGLP